MSYIDLHPGSPDVAGIRHERLTEELTLDNWKEKLIVRRIDGRPALVYVQMLTDDRSEPKRRKFEIWTWGAAVKCPEFEGDDLAGAIAYANSLGEPVDRSEWPPEEPAPWFITVAPPRGSAGDESTDPMTKGGSR